MTLPPGTILQLMYLKERLRDIPPGTFVEIGVGQGHLSASLLELGWKGTGFEIEPDSAEATRVLNKEAIESGRYQVYQESWLNSDKVMQADLVLSSMVIEHLDEEDEARYLQRCRESLNKNGLAVLLVPASPVDWGIEDEIAGHYRRYTASGLRTKLEDAGWTVRHMAGLTYPVSNLLLPISNFLVRRAESHRRSLDMQARTRESGKRKVAGKTHFPSVARLVLNEISMYPLFLLQKACSGAARALVLYVEYMKRPEKT